MDFIRDNYIWFIVGGVILIMAVIGYIADKTDFGRKRNDKKEEKKETLQPEPLKVEAKGISEITNEVNENAYENDYENDNLVPEEDEELTNKVPDVMPTLDNNEVVDESLFAPLETMPNDNALEEQPTVDQDNSQDVPSLEDEDVWKF